MRFSVLGFLIGNALILSLRQLPSVKILSLLLAIVILLILVKFIYAKKNIVNIFLGIFLGFCWVNLFAIKIINQELPDNLRNVNLALNGKVVSLPQTNIYGTRFIFKQDTYLLNFPKQILLSWYNAPDLNAGDHLRLTVRLKSPRGYWDVDSFNYQQWLFQQGIRATGYVVGNQPNLMINQKTTWHLFDHFRVQIANAITATNLPEAGLIAALAVGIRDQITQDQWQTLRGTGTNHLFAIAGLHIGIVSTFIYFSVSFLWRRSKKFPLLFATQQVAYIAVLLSAFLYSACAGFSLPTQRALAMLSIFLMATLLRRSLLPWSAWYLAVLLVLFLDPLSITTSSFWLSFGAVALILYGVHGRLGKENFLVRWGHVQWIMAFGLIPLSLLFFQQVSLVAFIANAIAIPWVGLIVLPLTLLGNLFWLVMPNFSHLLWVLACHLLGMIWPILTYCANNNHLQWENYLTHWEFFTGTIGIVLLLLPKKFPAKYWGVIWILPMILSVPPLPNNNEVWIHVFDTGGVGLVAIVQTRHHVLLYETGLGAKSNQINNTITIPFLNANKIFLMDQFIENDQEIQGLNSVKILQLAVTNLIWNWDGINFQVITPPKKANTSVLVIKNQNQMVVIFPQGTASMIHSCKQIIAPNLHLTIVSPTPKTADNAAFISALKACRTNMILFSGNSEGNLIASYSTAIQGEMICKVFVDNLLLTTYRQKYWQYFD